MRRASCASLLLAPVVWAAACGGSTERHRGLGGGAAAGSTATSGGVAPAPTGTSPIPSGSGGRGGAPNAGPSTGGELPLGDAGAAGEAPSSDLTRDILDTTLEVNVKTRRARATITLAPSTSTAASFEIADLEIGAVSSGGKALRYADRGDELDIAVPASKAPVVVDIDYTFSLHERSDGVSARGYTLTWPYFCANVFPCHSSPSDGTTFHLELLGVAANQTAIYARAIESDAPPYMAAWSIGEYSELSLGQTSSGTSVATWYLPGGKADAEAGTAYLRQAFDWLETTLGPYRFGTSVGAVAVDWGNDASGGMEHHPFWHVSVDSMGDPSTQVHEAAHGWFGNGVRLSCWEDFVLSEGTVSYLAARILEDVAGSEVSDPVWEQYRAELDTFRTPGSNRVAWPLSCGKVDILADGLYSRIPYVKGAFFYRSLEQKVGKVALDEALRKFYERYAGKTAGMQDMLDVIRGSTGYDPQACARAWLSASGSVPQPGACP